MALVKCKECGREISTAAEACPHCGYKPPRTSGCAKLLLAGLIGFVALVAIGQCSRQMGAGTSSGAYSPSPSQTTSEVVSTPPAPQSPPQEAPALAAVPAPPVIGSQWIYSQSEDQMAKGRVLHAVVLSTNTVNFDFPYSGAQHGLLRIRKDPRHGLNVMFAIERGQILCNSYDGCTALVRFDDGEAARFSATEPADNSSDMIFIENEARFFSRMKKSKRVRISVSIYQEGTPVFDFDVSGFDPAKFDPSAKETRPAVSNGMKSQSSVDPSDRFQG